MIDRYDEVYRGYRWQVPPRFNMAEACCRRHARDRGRLCLYWEDESGATSRFGLPRDRAWIPQPQRPRRPERAPLTFGKPEPVEHREGDRRMDPERRVTAVDLDVLGQRADLVDAGLPWRDTISS